MREISIQRRSNEEKKQQCVQNKKKTYAYVAT